MENDEDRWELGERAINSSWYVPGGFIAFYAAVVGFKRLKRVIRRAVAEWWRERRDRPRRKAIDAEIKRLTQAASEAGILRRTYSRPNREPAKPLLRLPPPAKALPPPRDRAP